MRAVRSCNMSTRYINRSSHLLRPNHASLEANREDTQLDKGGEKHQQHDRKRGGIDAHAAAGGRAVCASQGASTRSNYMCTDSLEEEEGGTFCTQAV